MSAVKAAPSATSSASSRASEIGEALYLPSGAHFFKVALQVNPFAYLSDQGRTTAFTTEDAYNSALVAASASNGISVIGVTDHHRIKHSTSLIEAARSAGIVVFPGFEAVAKDGMHLLCLFDADQDIGFIERALGQCGILVDADRRGTASLDTPALVARAVEWGAVCVAAHVTSPRDGLPGMAKGQARADVWKTPDLLACAIPGPVRDVPDDLRSIITNIDPEYRREHPIAVVNAGDVCDPVDLTKPGTSTFIKMCEPSIEGLRQAFLDPASRIRLSSDPGPEQHAEFVALAYEGGFLGGTRIHFNDNLNVLVGGRGSGKSTIVESLRFVLGKSTDADEAKRLHDGIVQKVLKPGTKVTLLVRSHRPAPREYVIERTVATAKPIVRDAAGKALDLSPDDVVPDIEIYGQHEISEMTRHPERLTKLLVRFIPLDATRQQHKRELAEKLAGNRRAISDAMRELATTDEQLGALPGLEERLRRFNEAGLKEKLADKREVELDDQHLKSLTKGVGKLREAVAVARGSMPKVSVGKARASSPNASSVAKADEVMADLASSASDHFAAIERAADNADAALTKVRGEWQALTAPVEDRYQKMLRELQSAKVNGDEYIALERQIAELQPLRGKLEELHSRVKTFQEGRSNLLQDWDEVNAEEFRATKKAADVVNRALSGRVRVRVTFAGDRGPLAALLEEHLEGRKIETLGAARASDNSASAFAAQIRAGKDALIAAYHLTAAQADKLAQLPPEVIMQIEELGLPPATDLDLNTSPKDHPVVWRSLGELSTGQRATTVLLLLLLGSDAPLVIDQPEDDLDNRFISEEVVPRMKEEKRRRQFVFSTHNANIPVLADAELILGMNGTADGASIPPEHMGAIDARPVRELVEEVLEGGREAFLLRKRKYRF